jgi:hypothetical protein
MSLNLIRASASRASQIIRMPDAPCHIMIKLTRTKGSSSTITMSSPVRGLLGFGGGLIFNVALGWRRNPFHQPLTQGRERSSAT